MYVLWPVVFQVLSSPEVQQPKEAQAVGKGLVPPIQPQGKDDGAAGWEPAHPPAPSGGDHSPCPQATCLTGRLGIGNKGKKKGGNTHRGN